MIHYDQFLWEHLLYIFQKFQILEPGFQIFQITDPRKSVSWPGYVFGSFVGPQIYRFVYHIADFYKFSPMLHNSFSYEPSRQYGISPFFKTILK